MAQLVEFPLAAVGSVLVEVTQYETGPVMRGLKGTQVTERAGQTFEEAVSRIRPAVEGVITQLRSLAKARPSPMRRRGGSLSPPGYPGDLPCPTKGAAIQSRNDEDQSMLQRGTLGVGYECDGEAELH